MYQMFRPWTHTSHDSYIYELSLVVATATVSSYNTHTIRAHTKQKGVPCYVVVGSNECMISYIA